MIKDIGADICDRCMSSLITNELKGCIVCTSCGVVKEDRFVAQSSEYRCFSDDGSGKSDPRRVGGAVKMHMDGQIDLIEIHDPALGKRRSYLTYGLQSSSDKAYQNAMKLIKGYCGLLDMEFLVKQAEQVYCEIKDFPEIKGKNLKTTIAAVVYLAGRKSHAFIDLKSFENIADSPHSKLLKACNVIAKLIPRIIVKSHELVRIHSIKLGLPHDVITQLESVCKDTEEYDIFDKRLPRSNTIAASALFFMSIRREDLGLTMAKIKEVTGVATEILIRQYASKMLEKQDLLMRHALPKERSDHLSK